MIGFFAARYVDDSDLATRAGRAAEQRSGGSSMEGDSAYFRHRASQERVAAMKAAHPNARQAHLEMAARFDDLAGSITARDYRLGVDLDVPTTA
jgi:hypothetical protein